MKKIFTFFIVGALLAGVFWFLSTNTILFEAMEHKTFDGFFFLREPDAKEQALGEEKNPYVSDQVQLVAIDNESLGVLGKWPWYRDVHARYLDSVQRFSPQAVYFDVAFIMPEKMPSSLTDQLANEPEKLNEIIKAFRAMDNSFATALQKHDNVYLDLFLVGEKRPEVPYLDRIKETEKIMAQYSLAAPPSEPIYYYSLEPLVREFMEKAQPVTVNQWPDKDAVLRSFLIAHSYETTEGRKRYLFSAVLALLTEYYHIDDPNAVTVETDRVVLHGAKAPDLDESRQVEVTRGLDFAAIMGKIKLPSAPVDYNKNIYNYLINEDFLGTGDKGGAPRYPVHLLKKDEDHFVLLAGQEVFDAAVQLHSPEIDVVFHTEKDITIHTEENYAGVSHVFPVNFAGRQELPYQDLDSGERKTHYTIPTESYAKVITTDAIPDIPELAENGVIGPDYDSANLEKWFYSYCDRINNEVLLAAQAKYGELNNETVFRYIGADDPEAGRYVMYKMFFDDINYLIGTGDLPKPETLEETLAIYPEWLAMNDLQQDEALYLNVPQVLIALQDTYSVQLDKFYNKVVFTGAYSAGMADDIKVTPYESMFGVNVLINAFNTIVTDNQLARSPESLDTLLLFAVCIVLAILYGLLNIRVNLYLFLLSLIGTFTISFLLFTFNNYILQTTPLALANVGIFLAITMIRVLTEEKDKKFLKNTFSQYISPELIDTMYANKTMPALGGSSDIITAYFTDIQGFSTFSEKLTAHQLVELLNEYLSDMTDILLAEQGTLDKYEGDAIIAFFGAPMRFDDHTLRACRAAVAMQNRLLELREKWHGDKAEEDRNTKKLGAEEWAPGSKWPKIVHQMRMRIGVNTGEIVTGNMGSKTRMNYTMMGDPVNLAARLEAGAKQYGVFTMISEYTYNHEFHDDKGGGPYKIADLVEARFIDNITVVGKSEPVKVYELVAMKGELIEEEKLLFTLFAEGMELYLAMQWDEAKDKFIEAMKHERFPDAKTTPSEVYVKRCEHFKENPPVPAGEIWDGVYRLTSK